MATVTDLYNVPEVFPGLADLDLLSRITADKYAIYYTASVSQKQLRAAVMLLVSACAEGDWSELMPIGGETVWSLGTVEALGSVMATELRLWWSSLVILAGDDIVFWIVSVPSMFL